MALITFSCIQVDAVSMDATSVSIDSAYFLAAIADASHVNLRVIAVNPPRQLAEYRPTAATTVTAILAAAGNSLIKVVGADMISIDTVPVETDVIISKDTFKYAITTADGTKLYLNAGGQWKIVETAVDVDDLVTALNASAYGSYTFSKITPISINGIENTGDVKIVGNIHNTFQLSPSGSDTEAKIKDYTGHVMSFIY